MDISRLLREECIASGCEAGGEQKGPYRDFSFISVFIVVVLAKVSLHFTGTIKNKVFASSCLHTEALSDHSMS